MAAYAHFLGRKVTVNYRIGDVLLPASGTFVGDSGRSIFLEQHLEQRGRMNYFRWEIPYQHIHRLAEVEETVEERGGEQPQSDFLDLPASANDQGNETPIRPSARAATASAGSSAFLPHRTKTA